MSPTYLANKEVGSLKVAAEHLGRFSWNGLDLHADLLTLLGRVHVFVVYLDAGDDANIYKLQMRDKPSFSYLSPPHSSIVTDGYQW